MCGGATTTAAAVVAVFVFLFILFLFNLKADLLFEYLTKKTYGIIKI